MIPHLRVTNTVAYTKGDHVVASRAIELLSAGRVIAVSTPGVVVRPDPPLLVVRFRPNIIAHVSLAEVRPA